MKTLIRSTIFSLLILGVFAIPAMSKTLPAGEWRLEAYNFMQKIAYPINENEITMNIHEDGKLGGQSGCNVYGGSYSVDDGKLKIGDIISTMMACEEPSMKFEQTFFKTLEGATKFDVDDDKLTITDKKTANFLRFVRVEHRHKCPSVMDKLN